MFRNNSGLSYPYVISNLITINHSSASTSPTGYYYYFYDWEVTAAECISPRIPVEAIVVADVPIPDFQYSIVDSVVDFVNMTSGVADYIWNFGDGTFSSDTDPSHSYSNGSYEVYLTAENVCGEDSISYIVVVDYASIGDINSISMLSVYPVPASNKLNIEFSFDNSSDIKLEMTNMMGQIIWSDLVDRLNGKYSQSININGFPSGVYLLSISTEKGKITRKIVIQ